ncbi:hypothetical protein CY35_15G040900 [Sphagnum magellanicum]|nr:hypothetical protein CY35_15G040900 [Sphagnum magellanicum]
MSKQVGGDIPSLSTMSDLGAALPPGNGADRAGLVNILKDKLQYLAGQSSGYLESLPPKVKRRVVVLQELQSEHDELEAKFKEERAALEAKYQKLYKPLYSKRAEIVNGVLEVEPLKNEAPELNAASEEVGEEEKGVPQFWVTAMKTNEILAMQLSKTYHMIEDDEPILERAVGTEIEWIPGKNLTTKVLKKKPKKGAKNAKPVTKTERCESFFNFFSPPQVPDDEDIDQDTAEELQDLMEQDYDIGSTIKDKIIPHAVSWFTGEALQGEDLEDEDEEDNEDDEEDEDEDEDDDEENEDEEEDEEDDDEEEVHAQKHVGPVSKASAPKNSIGQLQGGEQPPECKQQ